MNKIILAIITLTISLNIKVLPINSFDLNFSNEVNKQLISGILNNIESEMLKDQKTLNDLKEKYGTKNKIKNIENESFIFNMLDSYGLTNTNKDLFELQSIYMKYISMIYFTNFSYYTYNKEYQRFNLFRSKNPYMIYVAKLNYLRHTNPIFGNFNNKHMDFCSLETLGSSKNKFGNDDKFEKINISSLTPDNKINETSKLSIEEIESINILITDLIKNYFFQFLSDEAWDKLIKKALKNNFYFFWPEKKIKIDESYKNKIFIGDLILDKKWNFIDISFSKLDNLKKKHFENIIIKLDGTLAEVGSISVHFKDSKMKVQISDNYIIKDNNYRIINTSALDCGGIIDYISVMARTGEWINDQGKISIYAVEDLSENEILLLEQNVNKSWTTLLIDKKEIFDLNLYYKKIQLEAIENDLDIKKITVSFRDSKKNISFSDPFTLKSGEKKIFDILDTQGNERNIEDIVIVCKTSSSDKKSKIRTSGIK